MADIIPIDNTQKVDTNVEQNTDILDREVTKQDVKDVADNLESVLSELGDDQAANLTASMMGLLSVPDEQFDILAPGVMEAYERSLNNPNDRIALIQALNASGYRAEDLTESIDEIYKAVDQMALPTAKRDFLKQLFATLSNAVNETEGISKRYINVPIELCDERAKIPQYAHITDSGLDVFALEDINVHPGETVLVSTGVKVALPPGYELQVRPKSGRALKTKLRIANTPGTIDAGYRDEIKVIIENVEAPIKNITVDEEGKVTSILYGQDFTIGAGEKFCQLVLSEIPKVAFYRVESIKDVDDLDRKGGFGSTGLK